MDNRPNTESGQPKRTTAMGTMTMAPRAAAPGMGSGISLPPLMEVLGDYYRSPHNDSSRFNMPRRFAERESPLLSRRTTPPLPAISSIASVLDPTSSSPKRRKLLNSPPRRPITLARPTSSKRTASEAFEREGTQPTVPYTGYTPVYPPAETERRRHSNISSTSHPETPSLPPVSAITTSRGSSSESERHTVPLPSLFSHNAPPPTPHTSGRGYPYDPDYPAQYNPPTYYRHSGEQHQPYLPPSPTPHSHYSSHSHSPPHHAPLLTQPYTATSRPGMYRPSQATSAQDRTPFSHGSLDSYDQVARLGVKRRRGNLPKQVTDTLRSWLTNHVAHPYPTEEEKQQLCQITGLNMNQISNWFINARRRKLPQQRNDTEPPHLLAQARNTTPPRPSPSLGHTRSHSHENILPPPQPQGPYPPSGR